MTLAPTTRHLPCLLAGALGLVGLLACSGGHPHAQPQVDDVYVAGYESSGVDMGGFIPNLAVTWTNGAKKVLTPGTAGAVATSVVVSGGDVYIGGQEVIGNQVFARYWKNGSPVSVTDGTQRVFVNAIAVSGADVYLGGGENDLVKYWKNGVPVTLTDGKSGGSIWSLAVSGNDVYAAGFEYGETLVGPNSYVIAPVAKYWKNGVPVLLSDGTRTAVANAIVVANGDVYVAGFEALSMSSGAPYIAKYWKNGVPVVLTPKPWGPSHDPSPWSDPMSMWRATRATARWWWPNTGATGLPWS